MLYCQESEAEAIAIIHFIAESETHAISPMFTFSKVPSGNMIQIRNESEGKYA